MSTASPSFKRFFKELDDDEIEQKWRETADIREYMATRFNSVLCTDLRTRESIEGAMAEATGFTFKLQEKKDDEGKIRTPT